MKNIILSLVALCSVLMLSAQQMPDCQSPENLSLSNLKATSVTLNWGLAVGRDVPTVYTLVVKDENRAVVYQDNAVSAPYMSYNITGLTPNKIYTIELTGNCNASSSGYSNTASITFSTPCATLPAPYVQDFDTLTVPPRCTYSNGASISYVGHIGKGLMMNVSVAEGAYFVFPELALASNDVECSLWIKTSTVQNGNIPVQIGLVTDPADIASSFEPLCFDTLDDLNWREIRMNTSATLEEVYATSMIAINLPSGLDADVFIDDVCIRQIPTCIRPEDFAISNITSNSVDVSWSTTNAANCRIYVTGEEGSYSVLATTNPYTLTGLTANSDYSLALRAICSATDSSEMSSETLSFRTKCTVSPSALFIESFDTLTLANSVPECWEMGWFVKSKGTQVGAPFTSTVAQVHSGARAMVLQNQATGNSSYVTSRMLPIDEPGKYTLSVWVYRQNASQYQLESLRFWASPSYNSKVGATLLGSVPLHYQSFPAEPTANIWYNYQYVIPNAGNQYIIVEGISENGASIYFDDIEVMLTPSCVKVSDIRVSNITSSAADLVWNAGNDEAQWGVRYTLTQNNNIIANVTDTVSQTSVNLAGLAPATVYSITGSVRALCSGGEMSDSVAFSQTFTTSCLPIALLPYTCGFENTELAVMNNPLPLCWQRLNNANLSLSYYPNVAGSADLAHTGSGALRFYPYHSVIFNYGDYQLAILPEIDAAYPINTLRMTFYARTHEVTTSHNFIVGVITDADDVTTFVPIDSFPVSSNVYRRHEVLFDQYAGTGGRMAMMVRAMNGTEPVIYVDDLVVDQIPSCRDIAGTGVEVSDIIDVGARITVTDTTATTWQYAYGPVGAPVSSLTPVTSTFANVQLTGLTPSTTYSVYARRVCGAEYGNWSDAVNFTTMCAAASLPYSDDFEMYALGTLHSCYAIDNVNNVDSFHVFSSVTGTTVNQTFNHTRAGRQGLSSSNGRVHTAVTAEMSAAAYVHLEEGKNYQISLFAKKYDNTYSDHGYDITFRMGTTMSYMTPIGTHNVTSTYFSRYSSTFTVPTTGNYYVGFMTNAGRGNRQYYPYIDDLVIEEVACMPPTSAIITDITPQSAVININSSAQMWEVAVSSFPIDIEKEIDADIMFDTVRTSAVSVTGLRSNAEYYYTVRSLCANGEVSRWLTPSSFHTFCQTVTAPYSEDFEMIQSTKCWSIIGTTGTVQRAVDQKHGGNASMKLNGTTVISPQFNEVTLAPFMLSAWVYSPVAGSIVTFGVLNDPDDPSGAEIVGDYTITRANSWEEINIPFDVLNDEEYEDFYNARYLVFSVPGGQTIYVDDVMMDYPPTCPKPANGVISGVTNQSATVDWAEKGSAMEWRVRCVAASGEQTSVDVTQKPYTITGLNASTLYTVYVSALCSQTDHSPEYSVGQFVTQCGVVNAPWSENFEMHTEGKTPLCWDTLGSTAPGVEERLWGVYNSNGNKSIRLWNWGVMPGDAMVTSMEIAIPATGQYELVYDYSHQATSGALNVQVGRRGGQFATIASHLHIDGESDSEDYTPIAYHTNAVSLAAYSGDTVRVRFYNVTDWVRGAIFVDNIKVRLINPCAEPSVEMKSLGDVAVRFMIKDTVNARWEYAYGLEGFDITTAQIRTTQTKSINLSGLATFTFYELYVRSVCGGSSYSDWNVLGFQTTVTPTEIPYSTDFGNPADNDMWVREGDAVNYFVFGNDPAALINSTHALYVSSDGLHYDYDVSVNSMACITRLFNFEDKVYDIEFDWQCTGGKYVLNGVADYGRFYLMPAYADVMPEGQGMYYNYYFWDEDIIPLDGNTHIELVAGMNHNSSVVDMTGRSGAYKLVFFWFTEQDGGASHYPLSVANLSLSEVTCSPLRSLAVPREGITETSIEVVVGQSQSNNLRWVISTSALIADSVMSGVSAVDNFTIDNLLPSMKYWLFVRSECNADEVSPWSDVSFRTLCGAVRNYPVTEDFEDSSFPPYCWSSSGWSRYNNRPYAYAHGNGCAHAGYGTNRTLVSPELMFEEDRQYYVSFWLMRSNNVAYTDKMKVYVSPTTSVTDGTLLRSFTTYDASVTEEGLVFYEVDIPEGLQGIYYVIFAADGVGSNAMVYVDDVTFGVYPRCREVRSAPGVVSRTATTVTLSVTDHNYTKIECGVAFYSGAVSPDSITAVYDTTYITGLVPNTAYSIFARGICSYSGDTTAWSPAVNVTTRVDDCFAPDGVSVVGQVSDTMAEIQWYAVPDVTLYQIMLSSSAGTDTFSTTETSYVLAQLTAYTAYTFAVRGCCSSGNWTDWSTLSFVTLQTPATMPYHTGFEPTDDNALWRSVSSAFSNFTIGTDGGGRHTGLQGLYVSADGSTYSQARPDGPGIEHFYGVAYFTRTLYFDEAGSYEVSFDWRCDPISDNTYGYYNAYGRAYIVPVGTILPADDNSYYEAYPLGAIELASELTGQQSWQRSAFVVNVPEAGYRDIVFQWYSFNKYGDAEDTDLSDYPLAVDNLDISYLHCLSVDGLTALTYSDTSATIAVERSADVGLQYAVLTTNVADSITAIQSVGATDTIRINGLLPETTYYVFVRQVCDSVYSSSWRTVSFRTTDAPAVLPYVCDFEDDDENGRWRFRQNQQNQLVIGTNAGSDGTKALYVSSDGFTNTYNNTAKSYAFATRTFYLESGVYYVSYDWRNAGEAMHDYTRIFFYPSDKELPVGTFLFGLGPSDLPTGAIAADGGSQLVDNPVMDNKECLVTIYKEGSYNMVVAWQNDHIDGDNPPFVMDNINIHRTWCNPPQARVVNELQMPGYSSAIISLNPSTSSGQAHDVEITVTPSTGSGQARDVVMVDTIRGLSGSDTVLITGTSPSTAYNLECRTLCSEDDYSVRTVVPFVTPCGMITEFPYHESFETVRTTYSSNMISSICWTAFGATSGYPRYEASGTAATDGAKSLKLYAHKNNAMTLTLPEMADISKLRMTFDVSYEATNNMPTLTAGYMTDAEDAGTYVAVCTTTASTQSNRYTATFQAAPAGSRIAFRLVGGNTGGKVVYLDNVNVRYVVDGQVFADTVCFGDDYTGNGFVIAADTIPVGMSTHHRTAAGSAGAPDTLYTLNLWKRAEALRTFRDTICGGEPYVSGIWNITNPETRRYHQVLQGGSVWGCDSTIELFLVVVPVSNVISDTICRGDVYQFGEQTVTDAGLYIRTYEGMKGCTVTDSLMLSVVEDSVFERAEVCYVNLPYNWRGQNCYTSGRYVKSVTGVKGCPQVAVLDLTVHKADSTVNVQFCAGGMVMVVDTVISEAGQYVLHRINPAGCDVQYRINVTELPAVPEDVYDVACEGKPYSGFGISGVIVTHDTVVVVRTRTMDGQCDSVTNIHLRFKATEYSDTVAYMNPGESLTWNDVTYTVAGDYTVTLVGAEGCDSVVTLRLRLGADDVREVEISVVPNPMRVGASAVIYGNYGDVERVEILNGLGETVQSFQPQGYPIEVSGLATAGVYYIRIVTTNGKTYVQKVIVR